MGDQPRRQTPTKSSRRPIGAQLSFTDQRLPTAVPALRLARISRTITPSSICSLTTSISISPLLFNSGGDFTYNRSTPLRPPTGDYNLNHTVDAGDYVVWRKTLDGSASPLGSGADGDSNGIIGPGDYTYWRARFGNAAPGSGSLAGGPVPEPATISLQLGWLFALTWRVRKRITARGNTNVRI